MFDAKKMIEIVKRSKTNKTVILPEDGSWRAPVKEFSTDETVRQLVTKMALVQTLLPEEGTTTTLLSGILLGLRYAQEERENEQATRTVGSSNYEC